MALALTFERFLTAINKAAQARSPKNSVTDDDETTVLLQLCF